MENCPTVDQTLIRPLKLAPGCLRPAVSMSRAIGEVRPGLNRSTGSHARTELPQPQHVWLTFFVNRPYCFERSAAGRAVLRRYVQERV